MTRYIISSISSSNFTMHRVIDTLTDSTVLLVDNFLQESTKARDLAVAVADDLNRLWSQHIAQRDMERAAGEGRTTLALVPAA